MDATELLWKQYSQNVELYKFYMDLTIKLNTFYYAITGAIFSFYFANTSNPDIKYAVILPLIMSIGFLLFFIYGAVLMRVLRRDTFAIRDALGLKAAPDLGVLSVFLGIFSVVFLVVIIGASNILLCR
tara:strand:+ start:885 stop:1268 length:384 start_codon:yes stop_codon:yes gene_type:complete